VLSPDECFLVGGRRGKVLHSHFWPGLVEAQEPAAGNPIFEESPMAPIYDLVKDHTVYSIEADHTVLEAARFMLEHHIGALPVLRNGELVGIFSERDIMNRVVAVGRTPGTTKVSEVMTANPKSVSVQETVENCLFLMREFGFRHLPLTDGKELKGLVSLRDIPLQVSKEAEGRRMAV
jgi:CBS domain-containing protein